MRFTTSHKNWVVSILVTVTYGFIVRTVLVEYVTVFAQHTRV